MADNFRMAMLRFTRGGSISSVFGISFLLAACLMQCGIYSFVFAQPPLKQWDVERLASADGRAELSVLIVLDLMPVLGDSKLYQHAAAVADYRIRIHYAARRYTEKELDQLRSEHAESVRQLAEATGEDSSYVIRRVIEPDLRARLESYAASELAEDEVALTSIRHGLKVGEHDFVFDGANVDGDLAEWVIEESGQVLNRYLEKHRVPDSKKLAFVELEQARLEAVKDDLSFWLDAFIEAQIKYLRMIEE